MANATILVIEDEEDIRELIRYNLGKAGYTVFESGSGDGGLKMAQQRAPDLIVLDLMLPGMDGLEVCRLLKRDDRTEAISILMLTARGEESDIVAGLELGADDYITKPFSPKVLIARIRAVLRRKNMKPDDENEVLRAHNLAIHPGRHEVRIDDDPVDLTHTEFKVLRYLARRPGWVFTRGQIVDAIHGEGYPVTDRSIDVQIAGLRKKLGDAGFLIETVRGVGYRFREST